MLGIALFITIVLVIIAATMLLNVMLFPRLRRATAKQVNKDSGRPSESPLQQPYLYDNDMPLVSILVPARNEAHIIRQTVTKLLQQDYANYELIVLDDNSEDKTGAILAGFKDTRLRVITGTPLPDDWMGKNWACHNLAQAAQGDILIFTDADVNWQPDALRAVVNQMQQQKADLLTVWATQQTESWGERLIVPLIAFVILGYLPIVLVHHTRFSIFAAANGQCMAWRRDVYQAVGGHQVIADNVLDDVALARLVKQQGYRLRMLDGTGLIQTRMYTDWHSVRDGFAKNILAGYGNSVLALLLATVIHWLLFLFPFVLLLMPDYQLWGGLLWLLGIVLRALSAAFTQQRILDALFMPISVLLMTRIAAQALYWHFSGGVRWKGRVVKSWRQSSSARV